MVWLGSNETMLLESGVVIAKNQRGKSLQKDREMGVKSKATNGTTRQKTQKSLRWNFGWKKPIFEYMKQNGTDMENMVESTVET